MAAEFSEWIGGPAANNRCLTFTDKGKKTPRTKSTGSGSNRINKDVLTLKNKPDFDDSYTGFRCGQTLR